MVEVKIKFLENGNELPLPFYATKEAAGADLYAAIPEDEQWTLKPLERVLVPTGFSMELPCGYEAQIRPRSGLAVKHGISMVNTPGTIDSDYRGEVKVCLVNLSNEEFTITRGMRIAQMVVAPITQCEFVKVDVLKSSERGEGGFGHTGVK